MIAPQRYALMRQELGPATMRVEPGRITFADGSVKTTDWYGNPLVNALAYALRLSQPGEVIALSGAHQALRIGSINPGSAAKLNEAVRANGEPLPRCAIVPLDEDNPPTIECITIAGSSDPAQGGIEDLTLLGVTLSNQPVAKMNVLVEMGILTGNLTIAHCTLTSQSTSAWGGYGKMWAGRFHGLLRRVRMLYNECGEAQEHAVLYWDNAGYGDPVIHEIIGNVVNGRGGGRTCIQCTNRSISGPSGGGTVRIEGNRLKSIGGGGGGVVTVAGHHGRVAIIDNTIECGGPHSGIVVWSDVGNGIILTPEGFTTDKLVLKRNSVVGGSRPHVSIAGVREVRIEQSFRLKSSINGPKPCIELDGPHAGPVANGEVLFTSCSEMMSLYSGFQSGPKVVRSSIVLSNSQIDAMMET